jgi:hypothetical protein
LHTPSLHVPVGHIAQALPPVPHALATVPTRHCPDVEQHPVQDGPQAPIEPELLDPELEPPELEAAPPLLLEPRLPPLDEDPEPAIEPPGPTRSERAPQPLHASRRTA